MEQADSNGAQARLSLRDAIDARRAALAVAVRQHFRAGTGRRQHVQLCALGPALRPERGSPIENELRFSLTESGDDDRAAVLRVCEALGQGICVSNPQGALEYANSAYIRMLRHSREQLLRLSVWDVSHPDDHEAVQQAFRDRALGKTTSYECRIVRGDGSHFPALVTGAPRGQDARRHGSISVVTDLTPLRRAEDTLRSLADGLADQVGQAFFESLVEQLAQAAGADVVGIAEQTGPESTRMRTIAVWENDRIGAVREFPLDGSACEDLERCRSFLLLPEGAAEQLPQDGNLRRDRAEAYCGKTLCDEHGRPIGLLFLNCRRPFVDPDLVATIVRAFASRATGELRRRRTEEQLLQARKLESVGRLAGGLAHDFNNVLTAVLGAVEMARGKLPPGHPVLRELGWIQGASERAARLTRQLLAFGRRQIIEPRTIDLNTLIRQTETLLRPILGERIRVSLLLQPELWPVYVDPGQFQQVLLNLAVNARDAMPDGGQFSLTTDRLEVGAAERPAEIEAIGPGRWVLLTISDCGVGMNDEQRRHAFEPFYSTKPDYLGSGMGLASCHGIVSQAGGVIALDSAVGRGTTFRIHLPALSGEAIEDEGPVMTGAAAIGAETILLVEDEPLVRAPLAQAMQERGYHVLEAADGRQALEVADAYSGRIDILVSDVVMPELSGPEVERRLVAKRPEMRCLFMSGHAPDDDLIGRPDALMTKPFSPSDLLVRIRDLLDR